MAREAQTLAEALTPQMNGRVVRGTVIERGAKTVGVELADGTRLRRVRVTGAPPVAGAVVDVAMAGAQPRVLSPEAGTGNGSGGAIIMMNDGSGGSAIIGAPSPHDLLGVHHTLPVVGAGTILAGPISGSGQPAFRGLSSADLPGGFSGFAAPAAQVGLTAVPGSATTAMRSDAAPALNQTIAPIWTSQHQFNDTINSSSIIPRLTDTYDLGSSLRLWRKGWLSEMDAVLFAQNTITLLGGWFIVGKNEGTFNADVIASQTQIDFGTLMTPSHFVVMRAALKVEYMQVGSLVGGTTYNVTRNLDGSGANDWPSGTPFLVLGNDGDGRIELNAYDTPRISIVRQGSAYNVQTEVVRMGDLNGTPGISSERYGFWAGDSANYMRYDPVGGFIIRAGGGDVSIDSTGISLTAGSGSGTRSIDWSDGAPFPVAYIVAADTGLKHDLQLVANRENTGKTGLITLAAQNPTGFTTLSVNDQDYRVYINEALVVGNYGVFGNGLEVYGRGLAVGTSAVGTNSGELRTNSALTILSGPTYTNVGWANQLNFVNAGAMTWGQSTDGQYAGFGSTNNAWYWIASPARDASSPPTYPMYLTHSGDLTVSGSARASAMSGWLPFSGLGDSQTPNSVAAINVQILPIPRDCTATQWVCGITTGSGNNASNYWTFELRRWDNNAVLSSFNTSGYGASQIQRRAQSFSIALTTAMLGLYVQAIRTGSPGDGYVFSTLYVL